MKKKLSEMSIEELWQLFPIILTSHKEIWKKYYLDESKRIKENLGAFPISRISHIGSTAIENICAKPIIDILLEIPLNEDMLRYKDLFISLGYILMSKSKDRISFNLGYSEKGFADKVFHLHVRYIGDNDELYFLNFLCDNPGVAKEYEKLKLSIWKKYEHNRDGYTEAKHDFIAHYTQIAKNLYKNKYQ